MFRRLPVIRLLLSVDLLVLLLRLLPVVIISSELGRRLKSLLRARLQWLIWVFHVITSPRFSVILGIFRVLQSRPSIILGMLSPRIRAMPCSSIPRILNAAFGLAFVPLVREMAMFSAPWREF